MYKCINTDEYGYEMCTMSTHNPKKRVQNAVRPQWSQHWVSSKKDRTINQFSTISRRICTSNTDGVYASLQRVPFRYSENMSACTTTAVVKCCETHFWYLCSVLDLTHHVLST